MNCDAAVDPSNGSRVGFISRDERGMVVLFAAKGAKDHGTVEVIEAEAIIWAIEACLQQGCGKIWVESDCLSLISKLQRGHIGSEVNSATSWPGRIYPLSSMFQECRWSHLRRQANRAADFLAKTN